MFTVCCVSTGDHDNRRFVGLIMVTFIFSGGFPGTREDSSRLLVSYNTEISQGDNCVTDPQTYTIAYRIASKIF